MKFCNKCDNMYYLSIEEETEKLKFYCRNCGNEDSLDDDKESLIIHNNVKTKPNKLSNVINQYTKYDPTLPRMTSMKCPNHDCSSNTDEREKEILYIRYDDINLKYVYMCTKCDNKWKTDN